MDKTTKKVLVGVGIGCGSLVLLGLIALGVGAWWVKGKVEGIVESGQKMQVIGQDLAALDKSYPFTPPPEGEVLAIKEARLLDYLAVRETALPVYAAFEKKSEAFNAKHSDNQNADMNAAMQATSMMTELLVQVHGAYVEGLKQHSMSPREFRTITQTLYSSAITGMGDQVQKMGEQAREQALQDVRKQLENESLTEEQRTALEEQEQELLAAHDDAEEADAAAPALSEASKAAATANLALMDKYKERITSAGSLAMDAVLFGSEGADMTGSDDVAQEQEQENEQE
jgi:hypothetical protein